MSEKPYRVHVVVDLHYGEHIRNVPLGEPVWIADSADNRPIIDVLLREGRTLDQFTGITTFHCRPTDQPEDLLISMLSTVDLHHGEYSHDPPYSVLNVIGMSWSEAIQEELDRFGLFEHKATPEGFITWRNDDR